MKLGAPGLRNALETGKAGVPVMAGKADECGADTLSGFSACPVAFFLT